MTYPVMPQPVIVVKRIRERRANPAYRFPSVTILMPFNPKMELKNKVVRSLYKLADKVIAELHEKYPGEMSLLLIQKLKAILKSINFNTHKKSLAIFVSPVFEKIYYLNIDLEEKVIVNESLQIRDVLYNKKQSRPFHIVALNASESRIYVSDTPGSIHITPANWTGRDKHDIDSSEPISKFSDIAIGHPRQLIKYLHQVDMSLHLILKQERLPVFVIGAEKLVEEFKKITKYREAIVAYLPGHYEAYTLANLRRILKQQLFDWQKIHQKNLLAQLNDAFDKSHLSFGLDKVRHDVINRKGKLLLMEKKYLYNSDLWEDIVPCDRLFDTYNKFSCVKNPIDEMIEKVLENGGDVEFVDNGLLSDYSQIALIRN